MAVVRSTARRVADRAREVCADDGSAYRKRIAALADEFEDYATLRFGETAAAIAAKQCHILLDMQVHTRSACA